MPLATRALELLPPSAGISPAAGRPLFVPPGIPVVRTGPTTRAELDRLLCDADFESERSGVRRATAFSSTPLGLFRVVAAALGFAGARVR